MLVIFAAVRPATGEDFALVLPKVATVAMAIFLEGFAGALPAHVHAVMALDDQKAVIDACCDAWNALAAETGRLKSLCSYPWIIKVSSYARRYYTAFR